MIKKIFRHLRKLFKRTTYVQANIAQMPLNELLKDRCALITGGTSGIGLAIAKAYLNSGAYVVITGRNEERLNKALSTLKSDKAFAFVMDNRNVNSLKNTFENIVQSLKAKGFPSIDILVNNAGVGGDGSCMPNVTEDSYDDVMDTNLKGVFFLSQIFGKYLITNNIKGNILNISSSSSLRPANTPYVLSKWGIRSLTLGLAKSLIKYGITVNGIAPGPTATPMLNKQNEDNLYLEKLPLGRFIVGEEIANMAVVLVSQMGKSIIGDVVYMTGGAGLLTYDDVEYNFKVDNL